MCYSNKRGRRTKMKWPDTFLIESSGRRDSTESIAELHVAKKLAMLAKHQTRNSTTKEETTEIEPDVDNKGETSRPLENDTGSDQDISEDDEFEESIINETSKFKCTKIFNSMK